MSDDQGTPTSRTFTAPESYNNEGVEVGVALVSASGGITFLNPARMMRAVILPQRGQSTKVVAVQARRLVVIQWLAQEIALSGTARFFRRPAAYDKDLIVTEIAPTYYAGNQLLFCAVPTTVECSTYVAWIRSWIETPWTPHLGDYLKMAAEAK